MMAEIIAQSEAIPSEFPVVADSPNGFPVDADVWQRIEAYIAHRYSPRAAVWVVEGKGHWAPPLTPATITAAKQWTGAAWETVTLTEGPYGYCLPEHGPYKITADVGGGDVPAAVVKAAHRLTDYLIYERGQHPVEGMHAPELSATSLRRVGFGEHAAESEIERPSTWLAKAMQNSGAADLLRPYRKAGYVAV